MEYEVWLSNDGSTLTTKENAQLMMKQDLLDSDSVLLHSFNASTDEEASAIYNLRMGFEPYVPIGDPKQCPKNCGSYYYPEGSGQCPNCGDVEQCNITPDSVALSIICCSRCCLAMSMIDYYRTETAFVCPVCKTKLYEWQGKEGPCGLFVWRENLEFSNEQLAGA